MSHLTTWGGVLVRMVRNEYVGSRYYGSLLARFTTSYGGTPWITSMPRSCSKLLVPNLTLVLHEYVAMVCFRVWFQLSFHGEVYIGSFEGMIGIR